MNNPAFDLKTSNTETILAKDCSVPSNAAPKKLTKGDLAASIETLLNISAPTLVNTTKHDLEVLLEALSC